MTPGPWVADLSAFPVLVRDPTGLFVAEVPTDEEVDGEERIAADAATIADAKAIAALPDLVESLQWALRNIEVIAERNTGYSEGIRACRAALEKAGL